MMKAFFARLREQLDSQNLQAGIDGLNQCCEYVWRGTSLDKMIKRAMRVLGEGFELQGLAHYRLAGRGTNLSLAASGIQLRGQSALSEGVRQQIESQLSLLKLGQPDYKQGVSYLSLGPDVYGFCLLGENSSLWSLLVWPQPNSAADSDLLSPQEQNRRQTRRRAMEFFIQQIQMMALALARFQKSQQLLIRDDLTGVYNHRYLEACLDQEIRRVQRFNTPFSLLFIDLDHFKPINDNYGHLAGSAVLRQVADALQSELREVDSVFRYGGDEYVVLLLEADSQTALKAAERIRRKIEQTPFQVGPGQTAGLTASIGVASCPEHGETKEQLLHLADESMYRSKRSGKNRVVVGGQPAGQPIAKIGGRVTDQ
jgi:diguanylate cyclase (GGDEF)-like protein